MPSESLIAVDGYLRTLADGSLVTDRNGAPCCCGQPGCCFCSDLAASPGQPCYEAAQPGSCGPPACCCGKSWEWSMKISTRLDRPDGFWKTTEIDLLARIDMVDNGGNCTRKVTPIRDYWRGRTSGGYDKEQTASGLCFVGNVYGSTSFYCRVTATVFEAIVSYAASKPLSHGIQKISNVFYDPPCNGEKVVNEFYALQWTSSGDCKSGKATYSETADFAGTSNDYTATATAAWSVKRLAAECCPDHGPPVFSTAFQPTGPVNPGTPGVGNPAGRPGGCAGCQDGGAAIGAEL